MKLSPKSFISAIGLSAASLLSTPACVESTNQIPHEQVLHFTVEGYFSSLDIPEVLKPQIQEIIAELDPGIKQLNKSDQLKIFEKTLYIHIRAKFIIRNIDFINRLKEQFPEKFCSPTVVSYFDAINLNNHKPLSNLNYLVMEFPEAKESISSHSRRVFAYISILNSIQQRLDGS